MEKNTDNPEICKLKEEIKNLKYNLRHLIEEKGKLIKSFISGKCLRLNTRDYQVLIGLVKIHESIDEKEKAFYIEPIEEEGFCLIHIFNKILDFNNEENAQWQISHYFYFWNTQKWIDVDQMSFKEYLKATKEEIEAFDIKPKVHEIKSIIPQKKT